MNHLKRFPLRNISKMAWKNDGFRSLFESTIHPEVISALSDWKLNCHSDYVLIGGLALSYYNKPRQTEDIDLIFLADNDIPDSVIGFKRYRQHAFKHIKTHVDIELLTPEFIKSNKKRFEEVFKTSIISDGIKVASALSLIILKLTRFNDRDKVDIKELLKYCDENNIEIDTTEYYLNDNEIKNLKYSIDSLNESFLCDNMHELECKFSIENNSFIKFDNDEFDIYVVNDKYSEPFFYFGKNISNRIKKVEDFSFAIKIPLNNEPLEVLSSSTDYKSFNCFKIEESKLIKWIYTKDNLKLLWEKWNKLNN